MANFYAGQFTLSTQLIKPNYLVILPPTQHHSFQSTADYRFDEVDWDCFCREVCEIVLMEESSKLGEPGKTVQIDESKIGKRKYHRGHHVEGQWVFGGIEESRRCFIREFYQTTTATATRTSPSKRFNEQNNGSARVF